MTRRAYSYPVGDCIIKNVYSKGICKGMYCKPIPLDGGTEQVSTNMSDLCSRDISKYTTLRWICEGICCEPILFQSGMFIRFCIIDVMCTMDRVTIDRKLDSMPCITATCVAQKLYRAMIVLYTMAVSLLSNSFLLFLQRHVQKWDGTLVIPEYTEDYCYKAASTMRNNNTGTSTTLHHTWRQSMHRSLCHTSVKDNTPYDNHEPAYGWIAVQKMNRLWQEGCLLLVNVYNGNFILCICMAGVREMRGTNSHRYSLLIWLSSFLRE